MRADQRRTKAADALIASAYRSGTNTRRVRRALAALLRGGRQGHGEPGVAQGADRSGRLERTTTEGRSRSLRLILDGTVVRVRLDKQATAISLLVVIGVREDGQKVLPPSSGWAGDHGTPGDLSLFVGLNHPGDDVTHFNFHHLPDGTATSTSTNMGTTTTDVATRTPPVSLSCTMAYTSDLYDTPHRARGGRS